MEGHIARTVPARAFGFIRGLDGREFFFHKSNITRGPREFDSVQAGGRVTFEVDASGDRGPRAKDVCMEGY